MDTYSRIERFLKPDISTDKPWTCWRFNSRMLSFMRLPGCCMLAALALALAALLPLVGVDWLAVAAVTADGSEDSGSVSCCATCDPWPTPSPGNRSAPVCVVGGTAIPRASNARIKTDRLALGSWLFGWVAAAATIAFATTCTWAPCQIRSLFWIISK